MHVLGFKFQLVVLLYVFLCLKKYPKGHGNFCLRWFFFLDVIVKSPGSRLSCAEQSELLTFSAEFSYNLETTVILCILTKFSVSREGTDYWNSRLIQYLVTNTSLGKRENVFCSLIPSYTSEDCTYSLLTWSCIENCTELLILYHFSLTFRAFVVIYITYLINKEKNSIRPGLC